MINHVLDLINGLNAERICVVVAPGHSEVIEAVHPVATAIQQEALGTAHAAKAAKSL